MRKEIIALSVALPLIWLGLGLATYSPFDPGWSYTGFSEPESWANVSGAYGAWMADFLYSWFGYGVLLFYVLPIVWLKRLLLGEMLFAATKVEMMLQVVGGSAFLALAGSALSTIYLPNLGLPQGSGGIFGYIFAERVTLLFGLYGGSLIFFIIFVVVLGWVTNFSWILLTEWVGKTTLDAISNSVKATIRKSMAAVHYSQEIVRNYKNRRLIKAAEKRAASLQASQKTTVVEGQTERTDAASAKDGTEGLNVNKSPTATEGGTETLPQATNEETSSSSSKDATSESTKSDSLDLLPKPAILPRSGQILIPSAPAGGMTDENAEEMGRTLEERIREFNIELSVEGIIKGPVVTRFECALAAGIKVSRVVGLAKDIARALAVSSVRVVEVIEGKSLIGIEVPNAKRRLVRLSEITESDEFVRTDAELPIVLGLTNAGEMSIADLARMPHLLVAGTTGSGKSVGINALLVSLLVKHSPSSLGLIMVDPKMLELSVYDRIPHLLTPVITDMEQSAEGLRWCVSEMDNRYRLMASVGVRNLADYNTKVTQAIEAGEPLMNSLVNMEQPLVPFPYIVVVIDELADMMMIVGKKVEQLIARIAQKARAAGIHLVLATQRPSVDVITGLIKANVPTRISYQVSSGIDSKTILDKVGAEQLLGHGDMLYLPPGKSNPQRVHGALVEVSEVERIVKFWKKREDEARPRTASGLFAQAERFEKGVSAPSAGLDNDSDSHPKGTATPTQGSESVLDDLSPDHEELDEDEKLYADALEEVRASGKASISWLQRKFRVGYNRSARIIELMVERDVLTEPDARGIRSLKKLPQVDQGGENETQLDSERGGP